jgi:formate-dependent nitrite reductase cytochrome c552 subunit
VTGQGAESQIFATCHSPYMIDHFKADEVIVTCPLDDGMSIAAPLSRHPDYERWKDELSTGDFWRTVGEAWVKDLPGIMEPLP